MLSQLSYTPVQQACSYILGFSPDVRIHLSPSLMPSVCFCRMPALYNRQIPGSPTVRQVIHRMRGDGCLAEQNTDTVNGGLGF